MDIKEKPTRKSSIQKFIDDHAEICPFCKQERLNYEMGKEICIYCEDKLKQLGAIK